MNLTPVLDAQLVHRMRLQRDLDATVAVQLDVSVSIQLSYDADDEMSDAEQVFTLKLVEEVEKHPCLYNYGLAEYSNKCAVDKARKAVAKEVDANVSRCKDKWRNIRTVFGRHLKPAPSGSKTTKPYYLHNMLQFLEPFVKPTVVQVSGNLPPVPRENNSNTSQQCDEDACDNNGGDDDRTTQTAQASPDSNNESSSVQPDKSPKMNTTPIHKKKAKVGLSEADRAFIAFCEQQKVPAVDSPRKYFLLSLLPDVDNMTDLQFRQFRRKVLSLVDGILAPSTASTYGLLQSESSSSSSTPQPFIVTTTEVADERTCIDLEPLTSHLQPPPTNLWHE